MISLLCENPFGRRILLSVIIPVFNGEKYIQEAINSVLMQPEKDLVVIVVNDGSTDGTESILTRIAKSDNRVIVFSQKNSGVSVARNNGIEISLKMCVDYVAFLDADDVWYKGFFCNEITRLLKNENNDLIGFDYYNASEDLSRGNKVISKESGPRVFTHFSSFIYNARLFKTYSVRFPERVRLNEDLVFLQLFNSYQKKYLCIHSCIFLYRSNGDSVMHQKKDVLDILVNSIIPAWNWLIKNSDHSTNRIPEYKSIQKAYIIESVTQACMHGKKPSQVKKAITSSSYVNLLINDSSVWTSTKNLNIYKCFIKHPNLFWIKCMVSGGLIKCKTLLRKNKLANVFYFKEKLEK